MGLTKKGKKIIKRLLWTLAFIFLLMNVIAFVHAWKFTHFTNSLGEKTKSPDKLSTIQKIQALVTGINNPRPINKQKPAGDYETIILQSNKKIECWYLNKYHADSLKGTVIIFHGYGGEKSSIIDKAEIFDSLQYNSLLVDFMGSGGSEGNITTIGYKEAEQVKIAYEYLQNKGVNNIYLFGTSMGAAAIMKALNDYNLQPKGIIIECPFGSMHETVCARFKNMNAPCFPMAQLLVFWGGLQNDFWAFGHEPSNYAKKIDCPALLFYGEQDKNVSPKETETIYKNLKATKTLKTFPLAGHENYLTKYRTEWIQQVTAFLETK
jgi:pimeloyl-ACP methyl ester carboxylesterase